MDHRELALLAEEFGTPLYVYDLDEVESPVSGAALQGRLAGWRTPVLLDESESTPGGGGGGWSRRLSRRGLVRG